MRILIAYYSRTGSTKKVAQAIKKEFENRGHSVDVEEVKPKAEHSFLGWWLIRMVKGEADILPPKIKDVSKYDAVCVGSPNWTRLALPMARYLRTIEGLKHKKIGFFTTTAASPVFEEYVLSAYLLGLTFSQIVEKRGGRIVGSIMLSSIFKKWGLASNYGRNAVKRFCEKIEAPITSIKDYFLRKKQDEEVSLLAVTFSSLFVISLILHLVLAAFGIGFLSSSQYFLFTLIILLTLFVLTSIKESRRAIFLGKYLGAFSLVLLWTLTILFLAPGLGWGRLLLFGYLIIFILVGFLGEQKLVLFTGLVAVLSYFFLFFYSPEKELFQMNLDLLLLLSSLGVVDFITRNMQKSFLNLLETQEDVETAKSILEIKVKARTRELEELVQQQEEIIKERTKEIQERVEELEKFHKLAVGRELKMIELKKEIKKLMEKLKKYESKGVK